MPITLVEWKPMVRNTLRGFVTIKLGRSLIVHDAPVHCTARADGTMRYWCGLPSKPQVDRTGQALRDDKGKVRYTPILEWSDRAASDRFSDGVIAAIEAQHPGALASDAASADAAPSPWRAA